MIKMKRPHPEIKDFDPQPYGTQFHTAHSSPVQLVPQG